jgi:transcriptional regulator with XRE-family HTH domain
MPHTRHRVERPRRWGHLRVGLFLNNYTYLSKVENEAPGFSTISEGTLRRLAQALDVDSDEMIPRAGKVPEDVQRILIDDFSLIKEIRERMADESAGDEER